MTRRALAGCEMTGELRDALARTGYWDEIWSADILPTEKPVWHLLSEQDVSVNCYDQAAEFAGLTHHYQGDVTDLFEWDHPANAQRKRDRDRAAILREDPLPLWDAAFMFPPCTDLTLAGAVWWKKKRATPSKVRPREIPEGEFFSVQDYAAWFFMRCVDAPAAYVAVENPRGDMTRRYRPPDQYVQPNMFGEPLIKLTGFWLKNLPLLVADKPVEPVGRVATGGGSWRVDMSHGRDKAFASGHEDRHGRVNRQRERNRTLPEVARAMAEQWTSHIREQEEKKAA